MKLGGAIEYLESARRRVRSALAPVFADRVTDELELAVRAAWEEGWEAARKGEPKERDFTGEQRDGD